MPFQKIHSQISRMMNSVIGLANPQLWQRIWTKMAYPYMKKAKGLYDKRPNWTENLSLCGKSKFRQWFYLNIISRKYVGGTLLGSDITKQFRSSINNLGVTKTFSEQIISWNQIHNNWYGFVGQPKLKSKFWCMWTMKSMHLAGFRCLECASTNSVFIKSAIHILNQKNWVLMAINWYQKPKFKL